jgi:hypothetical protein
MQAKEGFGSEITSKEDNQSQNNNSDSEDYEKSSFENFSPNFELSKMKEPFSKVNGDNKQSFYPI